MTPATNPGTVTEQDFQNAVVEYAHLTGWRAAHFRPGRTSRGWATPVAYDGAGFPDLVLCRDRILFAELKSDAGRVTPAQADWLERLRKTGAEVFEWRPRDWPDIEQVLQ